MCKVQKSFEPYSNPKNTPLGPQKFKNDPKIKSNSKVRIEGIIENGSCLTRWVDLKMIFDLKLNPPNSRKWPNKV